MNRILILLFLIIARVSVAQDGYRLNGHVSDGQTGESLQFAHIGILNTAWGTTTNSRGEFSLIIPERYLDSKLGVSYIGYESWAIDLQNLAPGQNLQIELRPSAIELPELVVQVRDRNIIEEAVEAIPLNHDLDQLRLRGFWRGTITNRDTVIQVAETAFDIYRHGKRKKKNNDMKLLKGRISRDSVAFGRLYNLQAGATPETIFKASFVEDLSILSKKNLRNHEFNLVDVTVYDGNPVYVVTFDKKSSYVKNGYAGTLLIETETLAFVRIEYGFSPANIEPANLFDNKLFNKLTGLGESIRESQNSELNFRKVGDKWYLSHARVDAKWTMINTSADYRESIFYDGDLVVTDIEKGISSIPPKEELARNRILENQANYSEGDFWKDYNYLEPDRDYENLFDEISNRNAQNQGEK